MTLNYFSDIGTLMGHNKVTPVTPVTSWDGTYKYIDSW